MFVNGNKATKSLKLKKSIKIDKKVIPCKKSKKSKKHDTILDDNLSETLSLNDACDAMSGFAINAAINENKEFCTSEHFDKLVKAYYNISSNDKENKTDTKIMFENCVDT